MSPVAADRLTCTTSVEVKIAYQRIGVMGSSAARLGAGVKGRTWCGRTRESFILSDTSAYPRRPKTKEPGARRATEETRRRADIAGVGYTRGANGVSETLSRDETPETPFVIYRFILRLTRSIHHSPLRVRTTTMSSLSDYHYVFSFRKSVFETSPAFIFFSLASRHT